MDIYSDAGKYLGRVIDLILDLEKGEVVRMTMQPLTTVSREEARKILREASVLYKNVKSVEDVVVVTKGTAAEKLMELPEEEVRGYGR
jgi:sporulation protein YlmC with PRC-barrel domain